MSVIRFFDFTDPQEIHDRMERILSKHEEQQQQVASGQNKPKYRHIDFVPALDVHESDKEIQVIAELPGLKKEEINIDLSQSVLTISGEHKQSTSKEEKGWRIRERSFGRFERRLVLPKTADPEKIEAKFTDGVLRLTVAKKAEEVPIKKTISIN